MNTSTLRLGREWTVDHDRTARVSDAALKYAVPGFRETQRFLMTWLPQAERLGVMNATHGMRSRNPVAVAQGAHAFLRRHPMTGR